MAHGPPGSGADAESWFVRAIQCARRQGSLSFELRAVIGLARLYQSTARDVQARDMLADVYNRFTEGFDTPDLVAARLLLEQLGDTPNARPLTSAAD
jgi:hypothetical protein